MRLDDYYCPKCDLVIRDVVTSLDDDIAPRVCPECNVALRVVCNGGTGSRYRFCDLPAPHSTYWKGQVQQIGIAECSHDDEGTKPVQRFDDGSPIRLDTDRSAERRDRAYHKFESKHGQRPIYSIPK